MSRDVTTDTGLMAAACDGCDWATEGLGALGNAAQHHDRTGHLVTVEVQRTIRFGDLAQPPPPTIPGQTDLVTMLQETQP